MSQQHQEEIRWTDVTRIGTISASNYYVKVKTPENWIGHIFGIELNFDIL